MSDPIFSGKITGTTISVTVANGRPSYGEVVEGYAALRAENERLREAIPALYGQYDDEGNPLWMDGAVRKLFALRAENERLREALKEADQWLSSRVISNFTRELRDRISALLSGEILPMRKK